MPIRQGGILANRASTWLRDHFCRSTIAPRQGCQVFSYKHPSAAELEHDFLWRTSCDLPERGRIGIFNRSYYEEVLIVRVHPEILRSEQSRALRITTRRSGTTGIVRSWIWRNTSTATEPAFKSSSTSPRRNSESAFWRARRAGKELEIQHLLTCGEKILEAVHEGL